MKTRDNKRPARRGGQLGSAPSPATPATEALRWLTPSLLGVLASLHGAPRDLAEAAIQLLPFGSRAALEGLDLAEPVGDEIDGYRTLRLTDFAFDVMAEAAAAAEASPEAVAELQDRSDAVMARLCAGEKD